MAEALTPALGHSMRTERATGRRPFRLRFGCGQLATGVLPLRRVEVVTTENIWTRLERAVAFKGRTTLVNHTVMLGDGTRAQYEVDESIPYSVATLVVDGDSVLLTRQFRYALGQ